MKIRPLIGAVIALLVVTATACTTYTRVNTDQIREFRKGVRADHPIVKQVTVEYMPTTLIIHYDMKTNPDEEELRDLFVRARDLVRDATFQQEVIDNKYRKKYESEPYPRVSITFFDKKGIVYWDYGAEHPDESQARELWYTKWYGWNRVDAGKPVGEDGRPLASPTPGP